MNVLITSGGCKVRIDDVRMLTNFSSGRYGKEIAEAFLNHGARVMFFHERGSRTPDWSPSLNCVPYSYYEDYLSVKQYIKETQPDIIVSAAAISDYITDYVPGKISSKSDELVIKLRKGEKVIASFRDLAPKARIIGFKLLVSPSITEKSMAIARVMEHADYVVYNDLTQLRAGDPVREVFHPGGLTRVGTAEHLVDVILK